MNVRYDIDNYLSFAINVVFVKQRLYYMFTFFMMSNVTIELHLSIDVTKMRNTSHSMLDILESDKHTNVYALFSHLFFDEKRFHVLIESQRKRWTNQMILSTLRKHVEIHRSQYYSNSTQTTILKIDARQIESRRVARKTTSFKQTFIYFVSTHMLALFWETMQIIIVEISRLIDFRETQLFFNVKEFKLKFKIEKQQSSMIDCIDRFLTLLNNVIDLQYVNLNRMYVDLAQKECARFHDRRLRIISIVKRSHIYFFRRCCFRFCVKTMFDDRDDHTYHIVTLLRDVVNLISISTQNSTLTRDDFLYMQKYVIYKIRLNVVVLFSFAFKSLKKLTFDSSIRQIVDVIDKAFVSSIVVQKKTYFSSKTRVHHDLDDARTNSHDAHTKFRLRWNLLLTIRLRLKRLKSSLSSDRLFRQSHLWTILNDRWVRFLLETMNKFVVDFEYIYVNRHDKRVRWDEICFMIMFLRCLHFVIIASNLRRESALYWTRREFENDNVYYDLSFEEIMKKYDYDWLKSRVNWRVSSFKNHYQDDMLFVNKTLTRRYHKHYFVVRDYEHHVVMKNFFDRNLKQFFNEKQQNLIATSWMHLVFRVFREDVKRTMKRNCSSACEMNENELKRNFLSSMYLCFEWMINFLFEKFYFVHDNRCSSSTHVELIDI